MSAGRLNERIAAARSRAERAHADLLDAGREDREPAKSREEGAARLRRLIAARVAWRVASDDLESLLAKRKWATAVHVETRSPRFSTWTISYEEERCDEKESTGPYVRHHFQT